MSTPTTYVTANGDEITGIPVILPDLTTALVVSRRRVYDRYNKREFRSKTRMYGATDALIPALSAAEPRYIARTDENSSPEDIAAEKEWLAWRRKALRASTAAVKAVLAQTGLGTDAKFSYKAGCSCGCSPGYVIEGGPANTDLFVRPLDGLTVKLAAVG